MCRDCTENGHRPAEEPSVILSVAKMLDFLYAYK